MLLFEFEQTDHAADNISYNDSFNPKIYDEQENMRPEVHKSLMRVATNFVKDMDIPGLDILDVILTGSSANYNWTKYSDIDLHLVTDIDVMNDPEMAAKFFLAAKNVWNNQHDVTIRDVDVEVYVEDDDEVNESLGRFSVMNNDWITKPNHNEPVFDKEAVNRKVKKIMGEIDHVMSQDRDQAEYLHIKEKIWKMRKSALEAGGEFAVDNLAFKVLRNMGYLQKILDARLDAEDKEMSVNEGKIKVTYDTHWDDKPGVKMLRDEGQSDEEAIKAVHKLVGGRNHRVERTTK